MENMNYRFALVRIEPTGHEQRKPQFYGTDGRWKTDPRQAYLFESITMVQECALSHLRVAKTQDRWERRLIYAIGSDNEGKPRARLVADWTTSRNPDVAAGFTGKSTQII